MLLHDLIRWVLDEVEQQRRQEKKGNTQRRGQRGWQDPACRRNGKTAKDRSRGTQHRNEGNKAARREWNNTTTGQRSLSNFPWATCNGKRNRSLITVRGGTARGPKQIRLDVQIPAGMR
jgi:hypothetical protein